MSTKYPSGVISATGVIPTTAAASGIWTLEQAGYWIKQGQWPLPWVGNLFSWGANSYGRLGLNNTTSYSSPVQVGALTTWSKVSCRGVSTGAIKTDGSLWTWGRNQNGQLGLGNTTYSNLSPLQVTSAVSWLNIAVGDEHMIATKTDGTLWTWGNGGNGALGLSTTISYSSPKQVGSLTTWLFVAAGSHRSFALRTDGALYSWGNNDTGVLGLGNTTYYSSPKQVASTVPWSTISTGQVFTLATKTDGTLWAWGSNSYGQLGQNNIINRSSPVQIGALTTWVNIATCAASGAATTTSGALWVWGSNINGQLGLNSAVSYSSPKQVASVTPWSKISSNGGGYINAIKTDGTLWAWGANGSGQLGLGTRIEYSSPKQVGSLSTWLFVSAGQNSTMAIKS